MFLSGIKKRIGFGNSKFLTEHHEFRTDIYEPERLLELLKNFDFKTKYSIPQIDFTPGPDLLEKTNLKLGFSNKSKIIGLFADGGVNPGTTMNIKQIQPEKYIEALNTLINEHNVNVLLIGSKEKESNAALIYRNIEKTDNVSLLSNLSVKELMTAFKLCSVVVGGDTGLLHLAGALGVPVVMFFGPTDPRLVAPKGEDHKIIWHSIDCAPCYTPESVQDKNNFQGNNFICKRGDVLCMNLVTTSDIINNLKTVLNIKI
jgi:ADP-heptose:LPS heptosyltransferase